MLFRLLTLLWLAVTTWFWWALAPVSPTWSLQHQELVRTAVATGQQELALVLYRPGWVEQNGPLCRGPIEFWSLTERKKVREVFSNGDEILTPQIPAHGVLIIRRAGTLYAASAFTGDLLCRLPGGWPMEMPVVNVTGTHLLQGGDGSVRMYDLTTGREVWNLPHYGQSLTFGPDFITARIFRERNGVYDDRLEILNRATGVPDHRFEHLGPLHAVHAFEDSRYAVIHASNRWTICDARSGSALWLLNSGRPFDAFRFAEQDTVLCSDMVDLDGNVSPARWRACDGAVLSPVHYEFPYFVQRQSDPEGRFVLDSVISSRPAVSPGHRLLLVHWNRWFPATNLQNRNSQGLYHSHRVLDTKRGIAYPLNSSGDHPRLAHDGRGCTIVRPYGVDYYEFPPRRDWRWLVGWAFLPPATVYGLFRWWRWHRRRKSARNWSAEQMLTVAPFEESMGLADELGVEAAGGCVDPAAGLETLEKRSADVRK